MGMHRVHSFLLLSIYKKSQEGLGHLITKCKSDVGKWKSLFILWWGILTAQSSKIQMLKAFLGGREGMAKFCLNQY